MSDLTMTVRTYAAIHVLPAVIAAQNQLASTGLAKPENLTVQSAASDAVKLADALIAELAKDYDS
jgi:hypothetical protein